MMDLKKSDIILMLLASKNEPVIGTTRLQKLLFLSEKERKLKPGKQDFEFIPYKFGPVSKSLYNDIDFLVNLGLIEKSDERGSLQSMELENIESFSASDFLSDQALNNRGSSESCLLEEDETIIYRITDKGVEYLRDNNLLDTPEAHSVEMIKERYNSQPLQALLQYVYLNYPDYTSESEIKDDIL